MEKSTPEPWYYEQLELGYNYRITDLQCALGISQLKKLDGFIDRRRKIVDIYKTYECPLAKVMRRELKKRNIKDLKVLWSDEKPIKASIEKENVRKSVPGSTSFVPPVAGMIIASEVIRDIIFGGE